MTRIVDIDKTYKGNAKKAIEKFFNIHPEHEEEWRETFEWMAEDNVEHFCDDRFADGKKNNDWWYSLWLVQDGESTYIALVMRA